MYRNDLFSNHIPKSLFLSLIYHKYDIIIAMHMNPNIVKESFLYNYHKIDDSLLIK
jgi:hypothetical protein